MILINKFTAKAGRISGDVFGNALDIIRDMPGRQKRSGRDILFELTAANLEYLKNHLSDALWDKEISDAFITVKKKRDTENRIKELKKMAIPAEAYKFPFKTTPYKHQSDLFFLSRDNECFGFFMEMGTGKSKVLIDTAAYLHSKGEIDVLLILAPNGVHRQWIEEQIPNHLPDWVQFKSAAYSSGSSQKKKVAMEQTLEYKDGLRIVAVNIESLSHKSGVEFVKTVLLSGRVLLAIDESARIKNVSSIRTKNCLKLASLSAYRRILSGAPVTKGVEDLYAQLKFLDPDILGYSSFYTFRNRFCEMGGYQFKKIVGYRNLQELQSRLDGWTYRITKKDCLDLPDKLYCNRFVELHPKQKEIYKKLKEDFFVQMPDGNVIDAPLAITLMIRLQQVLSGYLPSEDGKSTIDIIPPSENPRLLDCLSLIEESQGKVIVWARFQKDIQNICYTLIKAGIGFKQYHGQIKSDARLEAVNEFRNNPDIKVFVANPQAGGTGLNLAVASTVIYYSNDFNADSRWQSEDRTHRIGMKEKVTYYDLLTKGTIDAKISSALRNKKSVADMVIDRKTLEDFLT
jgi:superfamily II DNA or RNA helicase